MINFIENELNDSLRALLNSIYNDKNRHYHNYNHINTMLKDLDGLFNFLNHLKINKLPIDYKIMRLGIIFHDIVQNTSLNEIYSVDITRSLLKPVIFDEEKIDKICDLITATDYVYRDTTDFTYEQKLIRDLDLKGLSLDWIDYFHNGFLIRQEYAIPNEIFNEGRIKFLKHILSFPKIYSLDFFSEEKARENLEKELKILQKGY